MRRSEIFQNGEYLVAAGPTTQQPASKEGLERSIFAKDCFGAAWKRLYSIDFIGTG